MSETRSATPRLIQSGNRRAPTRRIALLVALTVVLCAVPVILVHPHVVHWLEVQSAYRNLASHDSADRSDALHWLLNNGENPDVRLVGLLDHSDDDVQLFAAQSLGARPANPKVTAALLEIAERVPRDLFLCAAAVKGLARHAETCRAPLEPIDHRIIAVARPMLTDSELKFEAAQVLAEYLPHDASLGAPLEPFLYDSHEYTMLAVARGCFRSDPRRTDMYLNRLVIGVTSRHSFTVERATLYLRELGPAAQDVLPRLQFAREESPLSTAAIDRAIALIEAADAAGD